MKKIAFIFPGQGSQFVGMARALTESHREARSTFDEADEAYGGGLVDIIFDGPAAELNRTEVTQPAVLAAGVAALRVLRAEFDLTPVLVAGHSLGEYTALVAAGAIGFSDAVRLVRMRGRFMQESVPEGVGAMAAVIGLDDGALAGICEEVSKEGDLVVCANFNSPGQVVLSGHATAVKRAGEAAKEKGARRVLDLPVSVPSHSPLMAEAAEKLAAELEKIEIKALSVPLVSNVEAEAVSDPGKVKELLKRQLTSPVRWVETVRSFKAASVEGAIEIGPGKVLSGLVRRIDKEISTMNFGEPDDIDAIRLFVK